jgi:hypothetical protein
MKAERYILIGGFSGRVFTTAEAAQVLDTSANYIEKSLRCGRMIHGYTLANIYERPMLPLPLRGSIKLTSPVVHRSIPYPATASGGTCPR